MKYVTSISCSIVPRVKSDTTRIAVASAIPSIVKIALTGWRVMLRNMIIVGCDTTLSMGNVSGSIRRNRGGAGGCIETAGDSHTTSRSARIAPIAAAKRLKAAAITYTSVL